MTTCLYLLLLAAPVDIGAFVTPDTSHLSLTLERADVLLTTGPVFTLAVELVDRAPPESGTLATDVSPLRLRAADGQLIVEQARPADMLQVSATVPAHWEIAVRVNLLGDISVSDRAGETYVRSAQGDVSATRQRGAFSLTTMAGELRVTLPDRALPANSAATAWNGDLTVDLPGPPAFNIEAQARAGAVRAPDAWRLAIDPERRGQGWVRSPTVDDAPTLTLRNISDDVLLSARSGG